jgi:hypothetical protein
MAMTLQDKFSACGKVGYGCHVEPSITGDGAVCAAARVADF